MPIFSDIRSYAKEIRLLALELCYTKRSSHLGGSFSIAEILLSSMEKFSILRQKQ